MNKYLVRLWVEESVNNLRTVWVEADSFTHIQEMKAPEFLNAIDEFENTIEQDYGAIKPHMLQLDSIELDEEHPDNIIPSDEKPDVEDIDSNVGRGK